MIRSSKGAVDTTHVAVQKGMLIIMKVLKRDFLFLWSIAPGFFMGNFLFHIIEKGFKVFIGVFFIRVIINEILTNQGVDSIFYFLVFSALIYLVKDFYFSFYHNYFFPKSKNVIMSRIRAFIYEKADTIPSFYFEISDFYSKYEKAVEAKEHCIMDTIDSICELVAAVAAGIVLIAVFLQIDIIMIVFAVLPVVVTLAVGKKINSDTYALEMDSTECRRKEKYVARSVISKSYSLYLHVMPSMYSLLINYYKKAIRKEIEVNKKYNSRIMLFTVINMTFGFLIPFLGSCFYLSYRVFVTGDLLIGDFASLSIAILNFSQILLGVIQCFHSVNKNRLFLKELFEFLHLDLSLDTARSGVMPCAEKSALPVIEIKDLSFRYPNGEKNVLEQVSMQINQGEKIAIVGYNGAGKTTLLKIILKLLPCKPGQVLFYGQDLSTLNEFDYRNLWKVMPQSLNPFSMSLSEYISENGSSEKEICPEDRMKHFIEQAGLTEVVGDCLSRQITKEFDEDGIVFSKGEFQRLAFVRLLYQNAPLIVLDEPSSAQDPLQEQEMFKHIANNDKN